MFLLWENSFLLEYTSFEKELYHVYYPLKQIKKHIIRLIVFTGGQRGIPIIICYYTTATNQWQVFWIWKRSDGAGDDCVQLHLARERTGNIK